MTRNEHILLIMSWARSFHGLSLEDCVLVAERVLDEDFNGSIADANPADVMRAFDKQYFKANSAGQVVPGDHTLPTWEEHGYVRPPTIIGPGVAVLSDNTAVDVALLDVEPLTLVSGGTIPVLEEDVRDIVLPIIFSDPAGVNQNKIDDLVADPPAEFLPSTHVETAALDVYEQLKADFVDIATNTHHHHH